MKLDKLIETLNKIMDTPALVISILMIIGFGGVAICGGIKVGCLVIGIFALLMLVVYLIFKYGNDFLDSL